MHHNHYKTEIQASSNWRSLNLKELWDYRELIIVLAWRDILALYKQAFFGIGWAIIRPVIAVIAYTLVFSKIAKLSSSGLPYPLFTLCGLLAWNFFSTSLAQSTISLVENRALLTKVYFPRLILPLSSLGRGSADFVVSAILFILLLIYYQFPVSITIIFFPIFILAGLCLSFGIGLFFAALCAKYYDLKFAVPFLMQIWFWLTPVAYGLENISSDLKIIFYLNPMTWIIQGFRWSLLGLESIGYQIVLACIILSLSILVAGLCYFRKVEGEIADYI